MNTQIIIIAHLSGGIDVIGKIINEDYTKLVDPQLIILNITPTGAHWKMMPLIGAPKALFLPKDFPYWIPSDKQDITNKYVEVVSTIKVVSAFPKRTN